MKYCLYLREDLITNSADVLSAGSLYGMKSDLYMYAELKTFLASNSIHLSTQNNHQPEECEVIICANETPFFETYKRSNTNRLIVLILTEPPVYNAKDWDPEKHKFFDKVFTYNNDLIKLNPNKYKYLAYPIDFRDKTKLILPDESTFKKKKFGCMVASAFSITKSPSNNYSLLNERYKILKWYNQNAPQLFDYFSRSNPINNFKFFKGASVTNQISPRLTAFIAKQLYNNHLKKLYRGAIEAEGKHKVLSDYKFNFCLENSGGINGYLTEKIFDCFFSQTVPIYSGPPNIEKFIPRNCYINFSDYKSLQDLHGFLLSLSYEQYVGYLKNAEAYLNSDMIEQLTTKKFVEDLYNEIKL